LLNNKITEKNIQVRTQFEKGGKIVADINMIRTVFRNIIGNAVKFTEYEGTLIIISKIQNGFVEFQISDNGVGINSEDLKNIFRIDKKSAVNPSLGETGTGLGLTLCKDFIELNKGEIWVESEVKKGTTFFFTLPASN